MLKLLLVAFSLTLTATAWAAGDETGGGTPTTLQASSSTMAGDETGGGYTTTSTTNADDETGGGFGLVDAYLYFQGLIG
ncbi:MAG TPA: hypothetical protein VF267_05605 [Gammaproteobacteria bacterium]